MVKGKKGNIKLYKLPEMACFDDIFQHTQGTTFGFTDISHLHQEQRDLLRSMEVQKNELGTQVKSRRSDLQKLKRTLKPRMKFYR